MKCLARNMDNHCCTFGSEDCTFLEENVEQGYRWSCRLRRELGSWDAVLEDSRYKEVVHPEYVRISEQTGRSVMNCRDWPGERGCGYCGAGK